MKLIKGLFAVLLVSFLAVTSFAHDTDLYMASGEGVEPNILIMFDNSMSMNEEVQAYFYDPATTYAGSVSPRDAVWYQNSSGGWTFFANAIADVACASARTALNNTGHYEGYTNSTCRRTSSDRNPKTLRTGNYRNYLASIGGDEYLPKLAIAKTVIKEFLDTVNGVRVGTMVFNKGVGSTNSEGGRIISSITSLDDATRAQLKTQIDGIIGETYTPLAETLYEAGRYFKGGASYFNSGTTYVSPIQYHCQRNYVIIITDGNSTMDRNAILASAIGDRDGDGREPGGAHEVDYDSNGTDYLDDVAKYLYDNDIRTDLEGQQNINTYTIGFTISSDLLERTATHGHGRYFYSSSAQELADAFQNIINDILKTSTSFVAPIVPVSKMERTTAGDKIYLALFQPVSNGMWSGNIKKYGVAQSESPGIHIGDIIDVGGNLALDSTGKFYQTSRSYWTAVSMDGGEVEKGGVGEKLLNRSTARNIYTYLGTSVNLSTHTSNAFALTNAGITPALLGLGSDTTGRDNLIKFVHGYDPYDDNGNGNTTEKRSWILGSFLHSRPFIIHYATRSIVFAGSNDGMLHAFDDSDGAELWAFIPPNLLNMLQALHADVVESFVDGSPKAYITYDSGGAMTKALLIFGERRGGNHYYALDVTDPLAPKYEWRISPDTSISGAFPYAQLGQTWSTPNIGKINDGTAEGKVVAFIGGGYDSNQDNDATPLPDDQWGRAVYVIDVLNGSLVWRYSFAEDANMKYCIPSDVAKLDMDGDGKADRLYVGDLGGRMWRFDIGDANPSNWTGKIIFKSNPDGATALRKIFYPPDVTLENDDGNYELLLFGTGDREHPKTTSVVDRIYAVKDKNLTDKDPPTAYVEGELLDVTADLLQTGTTEEQSTTQQALRASKGWYIRLESSGEKSLAPPVVFYKVAYFTTFSPTDESGAITDPCFVGEGVARIYALKYNNGSSVFNFDATNDVDGKSTLAKTDRSKIIGTAIPSGVIITFIAGQAVAYVGVGGGVITPDLISRKSLVPINWRIVF